MDPIVANLLTFGLPIVTGIGAFIVKHFINRLDNVEKQVLDKMSEVEVRQLLADRLEPLKEDLQEIKENVKKLFDLYMQDRRPGK